MTGYLRTSNPATNIVIGMIAGGTVAKIGGGNFANGAISGAFAASMGNSAQAKSGNRIDVEEWRNASSEERQRMVQLAVDSIKLKNPVPELMYAGLGDWAKSVWRETRVHGRFGLFFSLKARRGPFKVNLQLDLYSAWVDKDGNIHYTQGAAAELSVGRVDIIETAYGRSGTAQDDFAPFNQSGFQWGDWQGNPSVFNVSNGIHGPTYNYGIGFGVGAEATVPISP